MGSPTFYYYAEDRAPLTVLSFSTRVISDLFASPSRVRVDAVGGAGSPVHRLGPAIGTVTIRRERCSDASLVRSWRNLEDHLLNGGRVGFSYDHAKTWAGYASGPIVIGQTIAYTFGNAFSAWSSSATFASGDELIIEEPNPYGRRYYTTASSISSGQITMGSSFGMDFSNGCMVRYARFWPSLYLPDELIPRQRISSDHGLLFGLDLTLAVDPGILQRATWEGQPWGGPSLGLRGASDGAGSAGYSLEGVLGSIASRGGAGGTVARKLFG